MPFVRLNGWTVPVLEGSPKRRFDESARLSRLASGAASQDTVYGRRTWDLRTVSMPYADMLALWDWLSARPTVFRLDTDLSSNLPAALLTSTSITNANARASVAADLAASPSDAAFTGAALAPAHAATNLFSANVATGSDSGGNTTGFSAVSGATLARSTSRAWQGTGSLSVTTAGAGGGVRTTAVAASSGARLSGSVYLSCNVAVTVLVELKQSTTVLASTTITLGADWKRVQLCYRSLLASGTDAHIQVTQVSAGAALWFLDGLQLEQNGGGNTTPWVNGTRSSNSFLSVVSKTGVFGGPRGITLNAWATVPESIVGAIILKTYSSAGGNSAGPLVTVWSPTPGSLQVIVKNSAGTVTLTATGVTWPLAGWRMVTVSIAPGGVDGAEIRLYLDGVLIASSSPGVGNAAFDCTTLDTLHFGHDNGANMLNGGLDEVLVAPFPCGDLLPASLFAYGAVVPASWPQLTADGDLFDGSLTVHGQAEGIEFEPFTSAAGVHHDSGGQVNFKLAEL